MDLDLGKGREEEVDEAVLVKELRYSPSSEVSYSYSFAGNVLEQMFTSNW